MNGRVDGLIDECTHGSGGDMAGKGLYQAKTIHTSSPWALIPTDANLLLVSDSDLAAVGR
jgi:hypothetical protein